MARPTSKNNIQKLIDYLIKKNIEIPSSKEKDIKQNNTVKQNEK